MSRMEVNPHEKYSMTAEHFAAFLDAAKADGVTQQAVAGIIGCSQSAISEWRHGKRPIPAKVVKLLDFWQENAALRAKLEVQTNG